MRVLLLLLVFLAAAHPAAAQVVVRTSLEPEGSVVLGQHVRVLVDVLFPGDMPRPPRVAMPDMAGAQILRYETQATTINDRIGGRDHVGQRFEFALYPRRGGVLEVPAAQVTLLDRAGEQTGRIAGAPSRLEVTVPAGVDPSKPVVATTGLTMEQRWQPEPTAALKAGDAIVRTIAREAADIPGMAMLDLAFAAPQGVRVYVDPPQIDDRVARGDLTGRRTDRVTYVFERGGSFPIDAIVQPWWDLEAGRLRRAEARGVTLVVAAAPAPLSSGARREFWLYVGTTAVGLAAFAWWAWPRMRRAYAQRRKQWQESEAKAFRDLQRACRHGDVSTVYAAFTTWRRRTTRATSLASFAEELELAVFTSRPWSAQASQDFGTRLAAWRRASPDRPHAPILPDLNPSM